MPEAEPSSLSKLHAMYKDFRAKFPDVRDMDPQALYQMLQGQAQQQGSDSATVPTPKVVVVDVRTADEQAVSMIPSSAGGAGDPLLPALTKEQFEADIEQYKEHVVVCYCTAGLRSGTYAAQLLKEKGFPRERVSNLVGGIVGWTHVGGPLVEPAQAQTAVASAQPGPVGGQPTKRVHVYGPKWALQADNYESVMFQHSTIKAVMDVGKGLLNKFWS